MKRREQEVGLRQLADGWQLDYIDPSGKRRRPRFATRRLAMQEKQAIERAIEEGRDPAGLAVRVSEVAERYMATYRGRSRGKQVVESRLRNHVLPRWGHMLVSKVRHDDIQDWVDMDLAPRMSGYSANAIHAAFAAVMLRAEQAKFIPVSPCRGIKRVPQPIRHIKVALLDDYRDTLRALPGRYQLPAFLGLALGGRASEVLAITLDRVDFNARTITIDRQLVEGGFMNQPVFGPTKGSDTRALPVSELVLGMVACHVELYYAENPDQLLAVDEDGWPLGYDRFNRYWRQATEGTGMTRFHDVRHLSAALAKAAGANPVEIQERHGHKQLSTTARLYPGEIGEQVTSVRAIDAALASVELHGRSEPH